MSRVLADQIRAALDKAAIPFSDVRIEYGRIFVETRDASDAARVIAGVFGVVSTSPVVVVDARMDNILKAGLGLARRDFRPGASFAVGARRMGEHDFSSQDIREQLGALILSELGDLDLRVDLGSPVQTVYVEVRNDRAYLFTRSVPGVGGMPSGTQGVVVCVLSATLASAMAAYRVMRRGCIPVFLVIEEPDWKGTSVTAMDLAKRLASLIYHQKIPLYLLVTSRVLDRLEDMSTAHACLLWKRLVLRAAAVLVDQHDSDGIVVGDVIGEYCHHSLRIFRLAAQASGGVPILTPCAGEDLDSIIRDRPPAIDVELPVAARCPIAGPCDPGEIDESEVQAVEARLHLLNPSEFVEQRDILVV